MKLLEKSMEEILQEIVLSKDFLKMTSKAQATKAKVDNWDYSKQKSTANKTINKTFTKY